MRASNSMIADRYGASSRLTDRTKLQPRRLSSAALMTLGLSLILPSPALAVNLSQDGLWQVLLYPYYTVEKGQQTVWSIVNSTESGKALKVRFLEG